MARLNKNTVNIEALEEMELLNLGIELQGLFTDHELDRLKADFRKKNEGKAPEDSGFIPYWKFCLDNISVSYDPVGTDKTMFVKEDINADSD